MKVWNFLLLLLVVSFSACEEDFDVLSSEEAVPVVFGVINPLDSVHYIRITKTFAGEGNNLEYALIADSANVEVQNAVIKAYIDEQLVTTYPLQRVLLPKKEEGDFFQEPNYAYSFEEKDLSAFTRFVLEFEFKGKKLSASANAIGNLRLDGPFPGSSLGFVRNDVTDGSDPSYSNVIIKFNTVSGAREHKLSLLFKYREKYLDGSFQDFSKSITLRTFLSDNLNGGEEVKYPYPGERFLTTIASIVGDNPDVVSREVFSPELIASAAGEEFYIYDQATNASAGLGQSSINYTNIFFEDGTPAVGIFDAANTVRREHGYTQNTIVGMIFGEITAGKKFCTSNQAVPNEHPSASCQ